MPSEGPNNPSAASGGFFWADKTNVFSSDDARASYTLGGAGSTQDLDGTAFGFTVPSGSTIDGILLEVERSASAAVNSNDSTIRLLVSGAPAGDDKADGVTNWPTTDAYKSYGGATDTWGRTWTTAEVNASNFGCRLAAASDAAVTFFVDHFRITVYYTPPVGHPAMSRLTQCRHAAKVRH